MKSALPDRTRGIIAIIVCSALYALMGVAIRLLDGADIPGMMQVFLRVSIGGIMAFFIFNKDIKFSSFSKISPKDWIIMLVMGVVGYAVAVYFITRAFIATEFLNATLIYNTLPIFVYLYAVIFAKSKLKLILLLFTVLAIYGVAVISAQSFIPAISSFGEGEVFALLAAMTFSTFYVGRQLLSKKINNSEITLYTMIIAALAALVISLSLGERLDISLLFHWQVAVGLLIGVLVNVSTTYLISYGFERVDAVLGGQLILTEIIFSFLLGYFIYSEPFNVYMLAGGIIIVLSVFLTNKYSA